MDEPGNSMFDVELSDFDAIKRPRFAVHRSRAILSHEQVPSWIEACELATQIAAAAHGATPTRVDPMM